MMKGKAATVCERFCERARNAGYELRNPDEADFVGTDMTRSSAVFVTGYKEKSAEEFFGSDESLAAAKSDIEKLISESLDGVEDVRTWLEHYCPKSAYSQLKNAFITDRKEPLIVNGGFHDYKWIVVFSTE